MDFFLREPQELMLAEDERVGRSSSARSCLQIKLREQKKNGFQRRRGEAIKFEGRRWKKLWSWWNVKLIV
jgi:hypothetical protein